MLTDFGIKDVEMKLLDDLLPDKDPTALPCRNFVQLSGQGRASECYLARA